MPVWHETQEQLENAVKAVAKLTPKARSLLSDVIANQGLRVSQVDRAAEALSNLGFIYVRNQSVFDDDQSAQLDPSLWGEEALETWEDRQFF